MDLISAASVDKVVGACVLHTCKIRGVAKYIFFKAFVREENFDKGCTKISERQPNWLANKS